MEPVAVREAPAPYLDMAIDGITEGGTSPTDASDDEPGGDSRIDPKSEAAYLEDLRDRGEVAPSDEEMTSGQTHVTEVDSEGVEHVRRRRFSAY